MVVVVGKTKWPTPMLAAYIRFAALNPYWTCRPISPARMSGNIVVKYGLKYLDDYGYQVVIRLEPEPDDHRPQDGRLEGRSSTARSR